ncbi:putative N6-adenine-specific DNA methylase [Lachnospiraceae bacterium XBD2001]|nr:putative N6-adenine-specific DNA methylase [Lachnospiraceae bacterium XBD2001]
MKEYKIVAPCHFGMEAVLKREIQNLGYEITEVSDGRVIYSGDAKAVVDGNIYLRTAERILVLVGSFRATTFEELFQGIRALPWEEYIPEDGKFWVTKANSINSKLFSAPDIQSIAKKAMVERMKQKYHLDWFPEDGADYPVRIFIHKDQVMVTLDSTGVPLHKRGYRTLTSKAPIAETMAAALIMLTPWRGDRILMDPFCGSGTFLIEAAMMAANIAPGLNREFTAEDWPENFPLDLWNRVRKEARGKINMDVETNLQGFDIDSRMVEIARENAKRAGVDSLIHFQRRAVKDTAHPKKYGFIITNPPYGERLEDKDTLPEIYKDLGEAYARLDSWSMFFITSYEDAQKYIGRKADKNRKLYNGMLKTYFYQYLGPKPPKKK